MAVGHAGSSRARRLFALAVVTTLVVVGLAASARAATVEIYLKNAPSYCLDVKAGENYVGGTVWLYQCSKGGMVHWQERTQYNCYDSLTACTIFADTANGLFA